MLILIPVILLLLLAFALQLIGRSRRSIGSTWLMAAGSTLLVSIVLIVLRVIGLKVISIDNWSPLGIGSERLIFALTDINWVFAFLLTSILTGVVFTDTVRLGQGDNLVAWTGSMVLTAVGLLAVYSQSLLAVVISWTVIDLVELAILIRVTGHPKVHSAIVLEIAIRFLGTALILLASILSAQNQSIVDIGEISQSAFILILVGAILRLGIFPLHIPFTGNLPIRRNMGTILRMVAPLAVIAFLAQLPPQIQFLGLRKVFIPIGLITALYGAMRWIRAKNELTGRPFWMLGFSGLVLVFFTSRNMHGVIALALIMGLGGAFLFLHSHPSRVSRIFGILLLVFCSGMPITPFSMIWTGLFTQLGDIGALVFLITFGLLFAGFLMHLFRKIDVVPDKELWMILFYSVGLGLFLSIPWLLVIWQKTAFQSFRDFLFPVLVLTGALLVFLPSKNRKWLAFWRRSNFRRVTSQMDSAGNMVNTVFKFDWFITFMQGVISFIARPLNFLKTLLESEGGLLWAFIFLALISSVLIGEFV